jgi:argininosuccinate synthase
MRFQGLYDERQSSMDELGGFEPTDTTGFIQIESIRIKKYVSSLCFWFLQLHIPS